MSLKPLRAGMVGGGPDGFIGDVHRRAMRLDGLYTLVAGVFSRDKDKSAQLGSSLGISPERLYDSYESMAVAEAALPANERIEVAVIVTPTPAHAEAVLAFVSRGFAVVCDKPLCSTLPEADAIIAALDKAQTAFMLIHNYSGYPMVKKARAMVEEGRLGTVNKVVAEYEQGWLCEGGPGLSNTGSISTLADVGTHALQLLEYVTGNRVAALCADVATMVGGARSPDDANVLLRFAEDGARGVLIASQASAGQGNGLRLRVYGTTGGLVWDQENPEHLHYLACGAPAQTLTRGGPGSTGATGLAATHTPLGHPEGFLEAFANLYSAFHEHVKSGRGGRSGHADFPSAADGRAGLAFVEACMKSSEAGAWVSFSR